jgi:Domain of unknown function (DUF4331)
MAVLRLGSRYLGLLAIACVWLATGRDASASDHLDTPTVIADPAADIGDIFGWMSPDGRRLDLVMDIVAHDFSDRLQYVFHVDSGEQFGKTTATTLIVCQFDAAHTLQCWLGGADYVRGDARDPRGIEGQKRRFRVFAGLRTDPFFNNVKGARAAYEVAGAALQQGTTVGFDGCPHFDEPTASKILDTWRHTEGGPARNFLAGWKTSALVLSIDLDVVATGGSLVAVWGAVHKAPHLDPSPTAGSQGEVPTVPVLGEQIERTARPLIKTALVGGPLEPDSVSDQRKERYNRVARTDWEQFAYYIGDTLALYDGFDGRCGNQWLADKLPMRYRALARLLADDRLWINSKSRVCTQFLAVEMTEFGTPGAASADCGGRTPSYDASNIFRSLLVNGMSGGFDDGLKRPDKAISMTEFPFLAAP